jgi:hypothetical protein
VGYCFVIAGDRWFEARHLWRKNHVHIRWDLTFNPAPDNWVFICSKHNSQSTLSI